MKEQFLNRYQTFVDAVTSNESKDLEIYISRVRELHDMGINFPRLQTAANGLASETGEFIEIIKKITFQGKPLNDENKFHMLRELGDVAWYLMQACMALNINPYQVFEENIKKLESRYPGGEFDAWKSENRAAGDI